MKKNQKLLWTAATLAALSVVACVTINIYFPAEKVETVAEDIVNDVRGIKPPQEGSQSSISQFGSCERLFCKIRLSFSPAVAWAGDETTTVSNPTIRSLKEKMKVRFQALSPFYQKGALKEGDDGYLTVTDAGGLNLKEKRDLKSLVDAENSDRKTLYAEVAKALKIESSQTERIAEIFAKEWQKPVR
ncbi:MAG: DUF1318 domain-containing protein [Desulfobacteraceae bacterium]|nr:MAG: DUF1318 domain-containing protein [Desulfobacteraceae bacterium]